jgi:hypothetical protein
MSWKSFITAGLLCVLASPAFAAPSVSITNGGLDASGNWIWNVAITPTATGTPLATELGFKATAGGGLVSVANASPATWDTNTAGNQIFSWETSYGSPLKPEGIEANCTGCTVTNAAVAGGNATTVVAGALNEIFAALGSIDLASGAATQYLTIKTAGPTDTSLTSSIALSGSYDGANKSGRVAEMSGANAVNYKGFTGTASRTLVAGDANLSGTGGPGAAVTLADLTILAGNLNKPGNFTWAQGDFNGTTTGNQVTLADLTILASHLNKAAEVGASSPLTANGVLDTPGAGASLGAGSAVPEPASIALLGLAVLSGLGLVGRKR